MTSGAEAAGRPRDAELDDRILAAARELLATRGYGATSIAAVARAAGTTRPTVYLRWSSKDDLVTAAIAAMPVPRPLPVTDDPRADLVAELRHFHAAISRPHGMGLVGTALAEESTTPDLLRLFRERLIAPRRSRVEAILRRAAAGGWLPGDLDVEVATTMVIGAFYARYLASSALPTTWPERVVDAFWPTQPGRQPPS